MQPLKDEAMGELSKRLLEILFSSSLIAACIFERESGKIQYANAFFARLLGYATVRELLKIKIYDLISGFSKSETEASLTWLKEANEEEKTITLRSQDNSKRICNAWIYNLNFRNKISRLLVLVDTTDEKLYETLYRALSDINQAIIKTSSETELFKRVCDSLSKNIGFDVVSVGRVDPDSGFLNLIYASGKEETVEKLKKLKIPANTDSLIAETAVTKAYKQKKIILIEDVSRYPGISHFREYFESANIRSICAIPLLNGETVTHVLLINSYTPHLLSSKHMKLLEEMQQDICFALNKIEKEKLYRLFFETFENSPTWIVVTDEYGKITEISKAVEKISGYKKEQLIGKKPNIFKSGFHNELFYKNLWQTISKGEIFKGKLINRTKSGELIYLDTLIMPIMDNGKIYRYVNVSRDITQETIEKSRYESLWKLYKTLSEIEELALASKDELGLLKRLPEILVNNHDFDMAFLVNKELKVISESHRNKKTRDFMKAILDAKQESNLVRSSFAQMKIVIEKEPRNSCNLGISEKAKLHSIKSLCSIPIIKYGDAVGSLICASTQSDLFSEEAKKLLEKVQRIVTYAIEKFESKHWESIFVSAMKEGFDAVVVTDADFRIVYVSESVVKQSGYSRQELIGAHHSIFSSETHSEEFSNKFYNELRAGKPYFGPMTYKPKMANF